MNTSSRRDFIKKAGSVGLGLSVLGSTQLMGGCQSAKKQPNIVFVFADQHRKHAMGFVGEEPVITPHIDRFSDQSAVMNNAISSYSLCSPFRSTLMTGRFPLSTGIVTNTKPGLTMELDENEICLGDVWKANNYQTCYIGKWHLDAPELTKKQSTQSGADDWDAFVPPGPRRHGFDHWYAYNAADYHFTPHYWRDTPEKIKVNEWSPTHETSEAISFIRQRDKSKPFSLIVSWNPPHPPYVAPEDYKKLYNREKLPLRKNAIGSGKNHRKGMDVMLEYYAAVSSCDHEFGRILDTLKEEGIEDDTIVVYTADHGEMLGSHDKMSKNIWYEESINIPFMIRWPGKIKPGSYQSLFPSYDFMPSLLGVMGLPIPDGVEGTDRSGLWLNESKQAAAPSAVLLQRIGVPNETAPVALGQDPSPYVVSAYQLGQQGVDWRQNWYRGIRTEDATYVVSKGQDMSKTRILLYDNRKDKYQLNPRELKEHAGEYKSVLQHWLDKSGDEFRLS